MNVTSDVNEIEKNKKSDNKNQITKKIEPSKNTEKLDPIIYDLEEYVKNSEKKPEPPAPLPLPPPPPPTPPKKPGWDTKTKLIFFGSILIVVIPIASLIATIAGILAKG
jgi:hypothetical protein